MFDALFTDAQNFAIQQVYPTFGNGSNSNFTLKDVVEHAKAGGYCGINVPESLGGKAYTYSQTARVYEAMAHGDAAYAFMIQLHNNITLLIDRLGESEQIKDIVKQMVSGDMLNAFAITEGTAGSDPMSTTTYAVKKEDGYHVFGAKQWITNGCKADYFTLSVKDGSKDSKNMLMLLGNKKSAGLSYKPMPELQTANSLKPVEMIFDDFVVPHSMVLSERGFQETLIAIDVARIFVPAICVGFSERCINLAMQYLFTRDSLGQPIMRSQGIQWKLAELSTKVEAARQLVYKAAQTMDEDPANVSVIAAKAKLYAPMVAMEVATECMQLMGGVGFIKDNFIMKSFLLAKLFSVVDGSLEVQKIVLGRSLYKNTQNAL